MRQQRVTGTPGNTAADVPSSAWSPFRRTAFTVLWLATVVSNVGVWMQNAAAGWLMTGLTSDPVPGFACLGCDIRADVFCLRFRRELLLTSLTGGVFSLPCMLRPHASPDQHSVLPHPGDKSSGAFNANPAERAWPCDT